MSKKWKFVKNKDILIEKVVGRTHFWHYKPEISKVEDTLLVKVIMSKNECHNFHRHPEMNEIMYILKGTAEQWVENKKQVLTAGDSVYIDPNVVHATFNIGEGALEFLAILAPSSGWKSGTIDEYMNLPYSEYR